MKDLIQNILDLAKLKGADYADIRIVRREYEEIEVKNGKVEALTHDEDFGFGIRLLYQGAWGFACSSKMTRRERWSAFWARPEDCQGQFEGQGEGDLFPSASPVVDRYKTPLFNRSVWCPPSKQN